MSTVRALLRKMREQRSRPLWETGEPVTILWCDKRTDQPHAQPRMASSVVACDGETVTVVVGSGRKATHEVFWALTGWDTMAHPRSKGSWRLYHGYLK